ncbi:hypothetical protein GWN42_02430 [candidate division KSB1 bacterium]|nr:hypothetical protein [candidate division KSB1 bacterium]
MISIDKQTLQKARRALEKATVHHLFDPNVTHIDLGLRIKDSQGSRVQNELAVRVHLRKKLKGDAYEAFADKYPERVIDAQTLGFPVDIPEADYRLHYTWPNYPSIREARMRYFDVLRGGISIANEWSYGFGTLGGKVVDRQTGEELILSNWHVLAGSWFAKPGLTVQQPARVDGGTPKDTIAVLARDAMNHGLDAAVAKLNNNRQIVNEQFEIGAVQGVKVPHIGMVVVKSGRRSKVTTGVVTGVLGQTVQRYHGFRRIIKHIVHIAQIDGRGEISAAGDSGAWWLEKQTSFATALHFAGSNSPEFGLAISMPPVLDTLNVNIGL